MNLQSIRVLLTQVLQFFVDALKVSTRGGLTYHAWMGSLTFLMILGGGAYIYQVIHGLHVTGMNDYVSWGLYISNFTFFVGVAAAAVMLVLPTYILKDTDFSRAVLIGEGMAVGVLIMCLAFVTADMGGPHRLWHMMPIVGIFNWPSSMLTWDVLVLNGYLFINITIPFYVLFKKYLGEKPNLKVYLPGVLLSVFWAVGIHMVTAFLYAGLPAKPFWNTALLGPRFLASAFAAGPALMILVLMTINRRTEFKIEAKTISKLALIATVAAQVNLIMLGSEVFKEFYAFTEHSHSARYLFFGLHGYDMLVPWVWTGILLNVTATVAMTLHVIRNNHAYLKWACGALFVGIWIEKGLGLIVPGFIPSALGDIVEYVPTWVEIFVTVGIVAMGAFVFTALAKVALAVELKKIQFTNRA